MSTTIEMLAEVFEHSTSHAQGSDAYNARLGPAIGVTFGLTIQPADLGNLWLDGHEADLS